MTDPKRVSTVRVLSDLQSHVLSNGAVEIGVIVSVVGDDPAFNDDFGTRLGFMVIIRSTKIPRIGDHVQAQHSENFWRFQGVEKSPRFFPD